MQRHHPFAAFVLLLITVALGPAAETARAQAPQFRPAALSWPIGPDTSVAPAMLEETALDAAAARGFAGVVLVAEGDRVLLAEARGAASADRPARTGTAYDIGALAKGLTNAAIFRLEAEGRLRLNDPVGHYLPALPRAMRRLTLGDLLHERAGFGPATVALHRAPMRTARVVAAVGRVPLRHAPGTYAATDLGHVLLAAVVERVSGRRFPDYLRAEVLPRAGLVETELPGESWRSADFVADAGADARAYPLPVWTTGIGGVRMTAADLWRWSQHIAASPSLADLGPCGLAGGVCHGARGGFEVAVARSGDRTSVVLTNTAGHGERLASALSGTPRTVADSLR